MASHDRISQAGGEENHPVPETFNQSINSFWPMPDSCGGSSRQSFRSSKCTLRILSTQRNPIFFRKNLVHNEEAKGSNPFSSINSSQATMVGHPAPAGSFPSKPIPGRLSFGTLVRFETVTNENAKITWLKHCRNLPQETLATV